MSKIIDEIRDQLELEGYKPDTPLFEFKLLEQKVLKCQELQGVDSCYNCKVFDYCELVKRFVREMHYGKHRNRSDRSSDPDSQGSGGQSK